MKWVNIVFVVFIHIVYYVVRDAHYQPRGVVILKCQHKIHLKQFADIAYLSCAVDLLQSTIASCICMIFFSFEFKIFLICLFWNTHIINKLNRSVFNKKWAMVSAALCWCDWNFKLRWAANTIFTRFQLKRSLRLSICYSWYCQQTPICFWRHFVWIKLEIKSSNFFLRRFLFFNWTTLYQCVSCNSLKQTTLHCHVAFYRTNDTNTNVSDVSALFKQSIANSAPHG